MSLYDVSKSRHMSDKGIVCIHLREIFQFYRVKFHGGLLYLDGLRFLQFLIAVFHEYYCGFSVLQTVAVCGNGRIFNTVFGFILYL